jgi:hypothetical protein
MQPWQTLRAVSWTGSVPDSCTLSIHCQTWHVDDHFPCSKEWPVAGYLERVGAFTQTVVAFHGACVETTASQDQFAPIGS